MKNWKRLQLNLCGLMICKLLNWITRRDSLIDRKWNVIRMVAKIKLRKVRKWLKWSYKRRSLKVIIPQRYKEKAIQNHQVRNKLIRKRSLAVNGVVKKVMMVILKWKNQNRRRHPKNNHRNQNNHRKWQISDSKEINETIFTWVFTYLFLIPE